MKRKLLAVGLLATAPLVAEYLLGNQPITQIGGLLLLGSVYGGAAVLIREFVRHTGHGWPSILLLGAAFGLLLEGIIDQMIFNPGYLGLPSFEGLSYIPQLHISASMLQATLTLHTVWSIGVPIAIMEAFDPTPRQPWLGKIGLAATACIFVGASAALTIYQAQEFHFVASALQLGITAVVILACIIAAFLVRPQKRKPRQKDAPTSRIVMLTSFVLTSVYWLESTFLPDNEAVQWAGVAWWFVLVVASLYMYYRWSHCRNWNDSHRLAVAGGALLTYVWVGFEHGRYLEVSKTAVLTGNIIFGIAAITLLYLAMRRRRLMAITASTH